MDCVICIKQVKESTFLCPCYHYFCRACIQAWLQLQVKCPVCRSRPEKVAMVLLSEKNPTIRLYETDEFIKLKITIFNTRTAKISDRRNLYLQEEKNAFQTAGEVVERWGFNRIPPHRWQSKVVKEFIERELRVWLGETVADVALVEHIRCQLLQYAQHTEREEESLENVVDMLIEGTWCTELERKNAWCFARECMRFIKSGLSMDAYDEAAEYVLVVPPPLVEKD